MAVVLLLSSLAQLLPTARAASDQVWNTTFAFDRGDKSDPGAAFFAESGVDQPWLGYISHPSSFYAAGTQRTYLVWQGDRDFSPHIIAYDHLSRSWSEPIVITHDNPVRGDGHGAPVVIVSATGTLHVFCCSHDSALQYYRSTDANDLRTWTHMPSPVATGSYPNVFSYGSKIFLMYRDAAPGSGAHFAILNSTDDGATWGTLTWLLDLEQYWGNFAVQGNRLYFSWNKFATPLLKRVNVYVCYMDLDTRDVYSMDGTNLGWTLTQDLADAHCRVRDSAGVNANQPYVDVLAGIPYVAWNEGDANPERFLFSKWTGTAWSAAVSITTTDSGSSYLALRVRSASELEAYLTAPGFDHKCLGDCEYSGDIEKWASTDGGSSWSRSQVILTEAHSGEPVNFPVIPMNARSDLLLTFAEFGKVGPSGSRGVNPQTNLKLYAWGSNGFVRNPRIPSGNFGVETWTDNPAIAPNRMALANALGDRFASADGNADTAKWHYAQSGDGTADCGRTFTGSVANYSYTSAGPGDTNRKECNAVGTFAVTGDYDFQYKARRTITSGSAYAQIWFLDVYDVHNPVVGKAPLALGASNGLVVQIALGGGIAFTHDVTDGALTQIGTSFPVCTTCWVRVTRVGNTVTSYTSTDGLTWVVGGQETKSLPAAMYTIATARFLGVTGTAAMELDDFKVAKAGGLVDAYRTEGAWVSPRFAVPFGKGVGAISFAARDANGGTVCIDRVELRRNAVVLASWSGCPRSPLTPSWTVQGTQLDVRLTLKGDGTASPSATSVVVDYADAPWVPPGGGWHAIGAAPTSTSSFPATDVVSFRLNPLGVDESALVVRWEFGDGETAMGANVKHAYPRPETTGDYGVRVTACDKSSLGDGEMFANAEGGFDPPPFLFDAGICTRQDLQVLIDSPSYIVAPFLAMAALLPFLFAPILVVFASSEGRQRGSTGKASQRRIGRRRRENELD